MIRYSSRCGRPVRVSVILTCTSIERACLALDSVLGQSIGDVQVLLAHGGKEPAESFYLDERVEPVGVDCADLAEALGQLWPLCQGQYIAYLDQDDFYYPDHLRQLLAALDAATGPAVAYSQGQIVELAEPGRSRLALNKHPLTRRLDSHTLAFVPLVPLSCLMHERRLVEHSDLAAISPDNPLAEWALVRQWAARAPLLAVEAVTVELAQASANPLCRHRARYVEILRNWPSLPEEVEAAYTRIAGHPPCHDPFDRLLARAEAERSAGQDLAAAELYADAAKLSDDPAAALALAAQCNGRIRGRNGLALSQCRQVNTRRPDVECLLLEAHLHRQADQMEAAVALLERAEEALGRKRPSTTAPPPARTGAASQRYRLLKEMADCQAALGNVDRARQCYNEALAFAPSAPGPYLGLGLLDLQQEHLGEAQRAFRVAATLQPDLSEAHYALAMVCQQMQDYQGAFDAYLKCLELDSDNLVALLGLFQTSCQMGTFANIIHFLEVYLQRHPHDVAVLFCLATLYARDGRLSDALAALQSVLVREPDKGEARDLLMQVRRQMRDRRPGELRLATAEA